MTHLAPHLAAFLREHLPNRCNASQHTVVSYADSFVLLLGFAAGRLDPLSHRSPDVAVAGQSKDREARKATLSDTDWRNRRALAARRTGARNPRPGRAPAPLRAAC